MKEGIVLDIETAASPRLQEYKDRFDKAKMDEYEERKKENPRARKPTLKSDKAAVHVLTGQVICIGCVPFDSISSPDMFCLKLHKIGQFKIGEISKLKIARTGNTLIFGLLSRLSII